MTLVSRSAKWAAAFDAAAAAGNLWLALCVDKTPGLVALNAFAAGWCTALAWHLVCG